MKRTIAAFLALVMIPVLSLGSLAHAGSEASPEASPMSMGTGTSAAYLTITNSGDEADRLIGGSTDVAQTVEIHDMKLENDVMSMFELPDGLEIPAGETVELMPQSLHVMLIDLTQDLNPGDMVELTLEFEHAGEVTLTVPVGFEAPEEETEITAGDLVISGAWMRAAPMLSDSMPMGTPDASPEADAQN
jgi:copper(I)-binding protein